MNKDKIVNELFDKISEIEQNKIKEQFNKTTDKTTKLDKKEASLIISALDKVLNDETIED